MKSKLTPSRRPIVGIDIREYDNFEQKASKEEKYIEHFTKIFFNEGANYIRKRCIDEIEEIRIASQKKRNNEMKRIINTTYDNWLGQLEDVSIINAAVKKTNDIEFSVSTDKVKKKIDELLPGVDQRFEKKESQLIPTVLEFINEYIKNNSIEIESENNKTRLEEDIFSAWTKAYPNHPRKLSSFHRNLPRKA